MSIYADTSFLVSLYTLDANSRPAAELMRRAKLPILFTPLGELELTNALRLRVFRKELKAGEARAGARLFRKDIEDGILLLTAMPSNAYQRAQRLSLKHTSRLGSRTLDILHVASAISLDAELLFTFDKARKQFADAEGLQTS